MASFDQMVVFRKSTVGIESSTMQLKDFLVEDQSSCSSSGFKSFPRKRQCCTTVRFLLELDLKQREIQIPSINELNGNKAKVSVLQRASNAVIKAVKHLPYRKLLVRTRFWGSSKGRPRLSLAADRCGPSDRELEIVSGMSFSPGVRNDMSFQEVVVETTVGEDSGSEGGSTIVKEWQNEEEKEQFSPVSILDCPFEDDDQTSSPEFQRKVAREGTKQKNLQKSRRFENLSHLEPVDLEKRIAKSELKESEHHDERDEKTKELMRQFKSKNKCYMGSKANNNLVFDYIKELTVDEESSVNNVIDYEREVFKVMEDWLKGEKREVLLGWEVKEGRKAYVKDMEKGGKWKRFDDEIQEVGFYLEANILDSLVHEILFDIL